MLRYSTRRLASSCGLSAAIRAIPTSAATTHIRSFFAFCQEANPEWHFCVIGDEPMITFLLWCILLVLCWPLALVALVLYPIVWLLLLPFRIVGIAVGGVLELIWALITLPARILRAI